METIKVFPKFENGPAIDGVPSPSKESVVLIWDDFTKGLSYKKTDGETVQIEQIKGIGKTVINTTPFLFLGDTYILEVDTSLISISIEFNSQVMRRLLGVQTTVKDISGNAGTNNITFTGGDWDNSVGYTINSNNGAVTFYASDTFSNNFITSKL